MSRSGDPLELLERHPELPAYQLRGLLDRLSREPLAPTADHRYLAAAQTVSARLTGWRQGNSGSLAQTFGDT